MNVEGEKGYENKTCHYCKKTHRDGIEAEENEEDFVRSEDFLERTETKV